MLPVCLAILDGFSWGEDVPGNAVRAARTPNLTALFAEHPNTTLDAAGLAVGLPEGQMGNSEVGHLTIGAGRRLYQDLMRVNKAIEDGSFFDNPVLVSAFERGRPDRPAFADLDVAAQSAYLKTIEATPFFGRMRLLTVAGLLALPSYGGNEDKVGWKLVGFVDRHAWQPPFGTSGSSRSMVHCRLDPLPS